MLFVQLSLIGFGNAVHSMQSFSRVLIKLSKESLRSSVALDENAHYPNTTDAINKFSISKEFKDVLSLRISWMDSVKVKLSEYFWNLF